jgi:hypothetical protein
MRGLRASGGLLYLGSVFVPTTFLAVFVAVASTTAQSSGHRADPHRCGRGRGGLVGDDLVAVALVLPPPSWSTCGLRLCAGRLSRSPISISHCLSHPCRHRPSFCGLGRSRGGLASLPWRLFRLCHDNCCVIRVLYVTRAVVMATAVPIYVSVAVGTR